MEILLLAFTFLVAFTTINNCLKQTIDVQIYCQTLLLLVLQWHGTVRINESYLSVKVDNSPSVLYLDAEVLLEFIKDFAL